MSAKAPNNTAFLAVGLACAGVLLTLAGCGTGAPAPTNTPAVAPTDTPLVGYTTATTAAADPTRTLGPTVAADTTLAPATTGPDTPAAEVTESDGGIPTGEAGQLTTSAPIRPENASQVVLLQTVAMGKPIDRIAFGPRASNPVAASKEGRVVHVWTKSGADFVTLDQPETTVTGLAFSPDGRTLAAGSEDGRVYIWSLADPNGEPKYISVAHSSSGAPVDAVALSPDGKLLAIRPRQDPTPNPISLVAVADGKEVAKLAGLEQEAGDMAFSPDGTMLAVSGDFGTLGIYSVPDGKLLRSWDAAGSGKRHEALAWSPDGNRVATTSGNGDAHIWSAAGGTQRVDLQPDVVDRPNSFAWSPDGKFIAIGTYGTPDSPPATPLPGGGHFTDIALVRTSDGKHLQRLHGHTGAITGLAISAYGRLLVSASQDGTLRFWGIP